jgi:hypothetical protein
MNKFERYSLTGEITLRYVSRGAPKTAKHAAKEYLTLNATA